MLTFAYNADGLRTSKTVNGVVHNYYYAGDRLIRETYGNTTLDFFYDDSGLPYAMKQGSNIYYYITNVQGDVLALVDADGDAVATYEYDPYGKIISSSGTLTDTNPLRYRGYVYDQESGLYYLQSRYYNPEVGRFVNADAFTSTGQGLLGNNMFAYCLNNPINYYDPTGAQPTWADMGFEYDGSMGDFRRLEDGLPPLAYENWLRSQKKKNVDIVVSTIDSVTYKVTGLTNMTADMVYKQYQSMVDKHDQYDFTKIPTYLMVLGIGACWGTLAAVAIDIVLMCSDMMEKTDIQMFKRMAKSNQSVLIVVWEVSGDSMPTRTMIAYYIWDEESLPFWG